MQYQNANIILHIFRIDVLLFARLWIHPRNSGYRFRHLDRRAQARCIPFPLSGDASLMAGIPRNFEVFDPLDSLAEITQHIPNKGEHQIRYYGFYSNRSRGLQEKRRLEIVKKKKPCGEHIPAMPETDTPIRKKCRITWAALIMAVYEVDPLKCPIAISIDSFRPLEIERRSKKLTNRRFMPIPTEKDYVLMCRYCKSTMLYVEMYGRSILPTNTVNIANPTFQATIHAFVSPRVRF